MSIEKAEEISEQVAGHSVLEVSYLHAINKPPSDFAEERVL